MACDKVARAVRRKSRNPKWLLGSWQPTPHAQRGGIDPSHSGQLQPEDPKLHKQKEKESPKVTLGDLRVDSGEAKFAIFITCFKIIKWSVVPQLWPERRTNRSPQSRTPSPPEIIAFDREKCWWHTAALRRAAKCHSARRISQEIGFVWKEAQKKNQCD